MISFLREKVIGLIRETLQPGLHISLEDSVVRKRDSSLKRIYIPFSTSLKEHMFERVRYEGNNSFDKLCKCGTVLRYHRLKNGYRMFGIIIPHKYRGLKSIQSCACYSEDDHLVKDILC